MAADTPSPIAHLILFVAGASTTSRRAIENLRRLNETTLRERARIEVVDIFQSADRVREHNVVVIPTLVRVHPGPVRRLVGDLSDHDRVLRGLDLPLQEATT